VVDHKGDDVGKYAHISDCKGGPLAVVHFASDGTHSGKAGSAEQIEDQEAEACELAAAEEFASNNRKTRGISSVNELECKIGIRHGGKGAEYSDDLFLGNESEYGSNGSLPVTEAEGLEDNGDNGSDHLKVNLYLPGQ